MAREVWQSWAERPEPQALVVRATPEEEADERRRTAIDRLGNLTLVNKKLNPALSNDPWSAKREELAKHTRLRLNADLVQKNPEYFDEDVVDARGRELAALLAQEWPGPESF